MSHFTCLFKKTPFLAKTKLPWIFLNKWPVLVIIFLDDEVSEPSTSSFQKKQVPKSATNKRKFTKLDKTVKSVADTFYDELDPSPSPKICPPFNFDALPDISQYCSKWLKILINLLLKINVFYF